MIPPYTGPTVFELGPLRLQLFGALVVAGVLVGHRLVLRLAAERGIDMQEMRGAAAWALGAGFFGAHFADVVFYHPEKIARGGLIEILKIWDGISSYGGFLGALAGVAAYFAIRRKRWWAHADILVQGLVAGWIFGRLACTLTSDHPGTRSDFALAFAYPEGGRHNLVFYELLVTVAVLVPAIVVLRSREEARGYVPGIYVATISLLYAPARFLLDFLRAADLPHSDPRWAGLTAAQFLSLAVTATALVLLRRFAAAPRGEPSR